MGPEQPQPGDIRPIDDEGQPTTYLGPTSGTETQPTADSDELSSDLLEEGVNAETIARMNSVFEKALQNNKWFRTLTDYVQLMRFENERSERYMGSGSSVSYGSDLAVRNVANKQAIVNERLRKKGYARRFAEIDGVKKVLAQDMSHNRIYVDYDGNFIKEDPGDKKNYSQTPKHASRVLSAKYDLLISEIVQSQQ